METFKQMRKRHDGEIDDLRNQCSHENLTDWMAEKGIFDIITRFQVRCCEDCEKVIMRRTYCNRCEKITEDYQSGNGSSDMPYGSYFCQKCYVEMRTLR